MPPCEERRGKWKRKRRGRVAARKPKQEDDDVEEEGEDDNNNNEDETDDVDNAAEELQHNGGYAMPDPGSNVREVVEASGVRISDFPSVLRRGVIRPHPSVLAVAVTERARVVTETQGHGSLPALENVSYGQLQALSSVPTDSPALDPEKNDESSSSFVISPPPILEGEGIVKRFGDRVHVVPMHSDWFAPDAVNRLERQAVPHFFSGKSPNHSPEKYIEIRNSIVSKYMSSPEKRLTVLDCKGLVDSVSDEDLVRVFHFLDHWGIVNYCAAVERHPESSTDASCVREDTDGEIHVPSAALKSVDSLIKFDEPRCRHKAADVYSSLSRHDSVASDLDSKIREHLCENHCSHCSCPLPTEYFRSQKKRDVLVCANCFHHGRFVIGHSSIDFIRVDPSKDNGDNDGNNWTDQETLLLLEAVELYHENWIEIAEHVGSKSKAQCILHFLRLPVEDGLLDSIKLVDITKSTHLENGYDQSRPELKPGPYDQDFDSEINLPLAKSPNPVMAMVAFLASAVGPRVAASSAHASLAVLSEDDRMESEGIQEFKMSNGEKQHRDENSRGHTTASCQNEAGTSPLPRDKIMKAVRAGLSAAATKSKLFADHEEREIQRLSASIVNHQLKRMELKLKQFAEIETLLMKECEQVEKTRQRFAAERAHMYSTRSGSIANSNSQQQQLTAYSSLQPNIMGISNNPQQQIHPQMQFMTRQQHPGFSFSPRLPINAIQTNAPSTPSPTVMFGHNPSAAAANTFPLVRPSTGSGSGSGLN